MITKIIHTHKINGNSGKKGEEITILYLSTPKYYKSRKDLFKDLYNFECKCLLCQKEKNNREKNPNILSKYDYFNRCYE